MRITVSWNRLALCRCGRSLRTRRGDQLDQRVRLLKPTDRFALPCSDTPHRSGRVSLAPCLVSGPRLMSSAGSGWSGSEGVRMRALSCCDKRTASNHPRNFGSFSVCAAGFAPTDLASCSQFQPQILGGGLMTKCCFGPGANLHLNGPADASPRQGASPSVPRILHASPESPQRSLGRASNAAPHRARAGGGTTQKCAGPTPWTLPVSQEAKPGRLRF